MATDEKIAAVTTKVDRFEGAMGFIKWALGAVVGLLGTEIVGHYFGWFHHG